MIYLLFVLLAGFSAWEEVQQLIQRGSWKREDYRVPIWTTDWKGIWADFDSHHIAFGGFVLIMFLLMYYLKIKVIWLMPAYWLLFFYIRNIWMHIIFKKKPLWKYLIPLWRK